MTISQSRWGSNAEVGRNPSRPPRQEQKYPGVVIGGAGAAVGGLGVYAAGRELPKSAQQKFLVRQANLGAAEERLRSAQALRDKAVAAKQRRSHLVQPIAEAEREVRSAGRRAGAAQARVATAVRQGARLRRGGVAGMAAGAGIAGLAAFAGERRRGTAGYRRSGKSLVDIRREAQAVPASRVAEAKAEGDRYRTMGRA